jgi:homoserine kinase
MPDAPRYVRSDAVLSREVEAALLLLAPGGDGVVSLSGAGPTIWRMLREPLTVADLVHALAERFAVPPEDIVDDVTRTVTSLQAAHVIRSAAA